MNRRKALLGVGTVGIIAASIPAFRWFRLNLSPDIAFLRGSSGLIGALADTIIPKTDTPSASECGVHQFIIKMVEDCTDVVTQNKFIEGLKRVGEYTQEHYTRSFEDCSADERIAILTHFEDADQPWPGVFGKVQRRYLGNPFFVTLKKYAAIGYFTSEKGATNAMQYVHIPTKYIPCESANGSRAWATN